MNFREMHARLIGSYGPFVFFPEDPESSKLISTKAFTHLVIDEDITVYSHKSMEEQIENEIKENYDVIYETPELKKEYYVSPYSKTGYINFKFKNGEEILKKALRKPFAEEIDIIIKLSEKVEKAITDFWNDISMNMSTAEIKALLDCKLLKNGVEGFVYPTIVAVGPESRYTIPSTKNIKLQKNMIVYIDSSPQINGFNLNFSRVIFTGEIESWISALSKINSLYEELFSTVKAGISCYTLDKMIRKIGNFPHYSVVPSCGFYQPFAPSDCVLEENMIMNIAPSIYLKEGVIRVKRNALVKKDGVEPLI